MFRFRNDSNERACGKSIRHKKYKGRVACLRRQGHRPPCISMASEAAEADNVCHGCREPLGSDHRGDCDATCKWEHALTDAFSLDID